MYNLTKNNVSIIFLHQKNIFYGETTLRPITMDLITQEMRKETVKNVCKYRNLSLITLRSVAKQYANPLLLLGFVPLDLNTQEVCNVAVKKNPLGYITLQKMG